MDRTISFSYSLDIIETASARYFLRMFLKSLVLFLPCFGFFGYLLLQGDRSWLFGVFLVFIAAHFFYLYRYHEYSSSLVKHFKHNPNKSANLRFTDDCLSINSEMSEGDYSWTILWEVLKFKKVWLFVYGDFHILIIPTEIMDEESKDFVSRKKPYNPLYWFHYVYDVIWWWFAILFVVFIAVLLMK